MDGPTPHILNEDDLVATLTARLYRWDCPDTQQVSEYAAGWLRGKRRRALTLHFRRCPRCTEELEISRQFLLPTPSALAPQPRPKLIAHFLPHQTMGTAATVFRGGGSEENKGWPRQYQADSISISLHRAAPPTDGGGAMLLGLISRTEAPPDSFTNIEVRMVAPDAPGEPPVAIEQIDDLGNFILSPIPIGRFNLLILLPEGDLVIEGLELRG